MFNILAGKTILIVDDEDDLRAPIMEELEFAGCAVFGAASGLEALTILRQEKIDAIISDLRMPNGDGVSLLKTVKSENYEFPVMMLMTGFSDLSREDAYELGAESILSKPFELDELLSCLSRILTPRLLRWKEPVPEIQRDEAIEAPELNSKTASIGRGGAFLLTDQPLPAVNTLAKFSCTTEIGTIKGLGIVRWSRHEATPAFPRGCGLEFQFLGEAASELFTKLMPQPPPVAFIPKA